MAPPAVWKLPAGIFGLLFPDQCRLCGAPLTDVSRIPVCRKCMAAPAPLDAEHFCVVCRTPFNNSYPLDGRGRCGLCRLGLNRFDAAYSFGAYQDTLRKLIHLFKYGRIRTLARPLGALLGASIPPGETFDAIVPMPLHWWRRWRRGFNQSELLAREIARRCGVAVLDAVRRTRPTAPQAGLSNSGRRENVAGAFEVRRPERVRGLRVALVDDVLTTGATANACAAALKRAGAKRVILLVLARVDRRFAGGLAA
jgi:ComF family protein